MTDSTDLHGLLSAVVVAANRMRDEWSEGDDAVRLSLWRNLHNAADAAYEVVFPLACGLTPKQVERFEAAADRALTARRIAAALDGRIG